MRINYNTLLQYESNNEQVEEYFLSFQIMANIPGNALTSRQFQEVFDVVFEDSIKKVNYLGFMVNFIESLSLQNGIQPVPDFSWKNCRMS